MRRIKQQITEEECLGVLAKEKRGILAVNGDGGYPYAVPINFFCDTKTGRIYFHGAKSGHKLDAVKADDKVCFTVCEQGTQIEDWSYHARSVVIFGRIKIIEDHFEAIDYVRKMAHKYYPEGSDKEIERDIEKNGGRMLMFEIIPDHMTGKLVHEK